MTNSYNNNTHGGDAEAVSAKLGLDAVPDVRLDFSVNINPAGPPSCIERILLRWDAGISKYPEPYAGSAASALAEHHKVNADSILVGNGSTEILGWIVQALRPARAGWAAPCYTGYREICSAMGIEGTPVQVAFETDNFVPDLNRLNESDADMIFLGTPNNPTGTTIGPSEIRKLADSRSDRWIVVDESFIDFMPNAEELTLISDNLPANLIVVKSLTKFFAVPGLRLGMACAARETIERIRTVRLPWSVNSLAQSVARKIYADTAYIKESRQAISTFRAEFIIGLAELPGVTVFPSSANFVLVGFPEHVSVPGLQAELLKSGILIRTCSDFDGLDGSYCRLAVRTRDENSELLSYLRSITSKDDSAIESVSPGSREMPPAIMVTGTMSHSGKSVIATALCRCFSRKGISVAPFKAQNMSLNSFVTREGGEIGRAQAVQAEAAGLEPHTDMNPVLLKPLGDAGSQVIVDGQPIGNFPAREYYAMKTRMRTAAQRAYDRLAKQYRLIILEGAGSPAEINLQDEDFVNMAMAEYANAAVVLVADIDRGGVFASIYGTISLIRARHRRLIRGIIINKFRGDKKILEPGLRQIEELTGVPVLGVLPYVDDIRIEDEDSLGLDDRQRVEHPVVDIVVIRLPRISNYTDFLALETTEGVSLRYESDPGGLNGPDLIIIPGTKNTCSDLRFLHDSGWAAAVSGAVSGGTPVFGICGGYQMLGNRVVDPTGVEGETGEVIGLNLLPVATVLEPRKELAQVEGITAAGLPFAVPGTEFRGYEIHAGRTVASTPVTAPLTITRRRNGPVEEQAGAVSEDGLVFGCYIHGLFDGSPVRKRLLDWLCKRKNVEPPDWVTGRTGNDFDRLADLLTEHADVNLLWNGQ